MVNEHKPTETQKQNDELRPIARYEYGGPTSPRSLFKSAIDTKGPFIQPKNNRPEHHRSVPKEGTVMSSSQTSKSDS